MSSNDTTPIEPVTSIATLRRYVATRSGSDALYAAIIIAEKLQDIINGTINGVDTVDVGTNAKCPVIEYQKDYIPKGKGKKSRKNRIYRR